jgi:hypothetical protein
VWLLHTGCVGGTLAVMWPQNLHDGRGLTLLPVQGPRIHSYIGELFPTDVQQGGILPIILVDGGSNNYVCG